MFLLPALLIFNGCHNEVDRTFQSYFFHLQLKRKIRGNSSKAQWVKVLSHKPGDMVLIPGSYKGEKSEPVPKSYLILSIGTVQLVCYVPLCGIHNNHNNNSNF